MNEARIIQAAKAIGERKLALQWLEQYGPYLNGRDGATVRVDIHYASSCVGAKEAGSVIASYASLYLPAAVNDAIACCKNDIAMSVDVIRNEIDKE